MKITGRRVRTGNNGKTLRETVYAVLDQHGDQIQHLFLKEQVRIQFGNVCSSSVAGYKSEWRKKRKINHDCRTYEGQPRRHMLNDTNWGSEQYKLLMKFGKKFGTKPLNDLFFNNEHKFHSLEQFQNCLNAVLEAQSLKVA